MGVLQRITNGSPEQSGTYLSTPVELLEAGWEEMGKNALGVLCSGRYFLFQETVGNVYDLAWALDQFHTSEVYLAWNENTGLAVFTGVTPECEADYPVSCRITLGLTHEDHAIAQRLLDGVLERDVD